MHELASSLARWPGIRALILSSLDCCLIRTYLSGNYVVFFPSYQWRDKYDRDLERVNTCLFFIKVNHVCCVCVVVSRLVSDLAEHKTTKRLPSVCGTLDMLMRDAC